MRPSRLTTATFLFAVYLQAVTSEEIYEADRHLKQDLESCLTQQKLDYSVLGLSSAKDLDNIEESHFDNLRNLAENKRGCFVACLYQRRRMIDSNGRLVLPAMEPDPQKKFKTSFEDAIKPCIDEKDFCKLGECLYNVYFL